jgi:Sigma-70 region 2
VTEVVDQAEADDESDGCELVSSSAFEQLYRHDYGRLVALAYGLSGSRSAAEELAQEAFLAAHRRWKEIRRVCRPGGMAAPCRRQPFRQRGAPPGRRSAGSGTARRPA